jgi:hypothetical protein
MNNVHASLDIETLGTRVDSVILSVGLCIFNLDNDEVRRYQWFLDLDVQMEAGRYIDPNTVLWWMGREEAARQDILRNLQEGANLGMLVRPAQLRADIMNAIQDAEVWTNGPSFDTSFLRHFFGVNFRPDYQDQNSDGIWSHRNDRDFRTLKMIGQFLGIGQEKTVIHEGKQLVGHNASDDALMQAIYIRQVLRALRKVDFQSRGFEHLRGTGGQVFKQDRTTYNLFEEWNNDISAPDWEFDQAVQISMDSEPAEHRESRELAAHDRYCSAMSAITGELPEVTITVNDGEPMKTTLENRAESYEKTGRPVPCPSCVGIGSHRHPTNHTISIPCQPCNGTGIVK